MEKNARYAMFLILDPFKQMSNKVNGFRPYGRYLKNYDNDCIVTTNDIFEAKLFEFPGDVHKYWHAHRALSIFAIQVVTVGD
jgi:hypothetical protein